MLDWSGLRLGCVGLFLWIVFCYFLAVQVVLEVKAYLYRNVTIYLKIYT